VRKGNSKVSIGSCRGKEGTKERTNLVSGILPVLDSSSLRESDFDQLEPALRGRGAQKLTILTVRGTSPRALDIPTRIFPSLPGDEKKERGSVAHGPRREGWKSHLESRREHFLERSKSGRGTRSQRRKETSDATSTPLTSSLVKHEIDGASANQTQTTISTLVLPSRNVKSELSLLTQG